jgi:hypothetical protein
VWRPRDVLKGSLEKSNRITKRLQQGSDVDQISIAVNFSPRPQFVFQIFDAELDVGGRPMGLDWRDVGADNSGTGEMLTHCRRVSRTGRGFRGERRVASERTVLSPKAYTGA